MAELFKGTLALWGGLSTRVTDRASCKGTIYPTRVGTNARMCLEPGDGIRRTTPVHLRAVAD